jgi:undecaprenyl-diphosphatase
LRDWRPRRQTDVVTLVLFLLFAASLWAFAEIADEVLEGETKPVDRAVLTLLREPGDLADPVGPAWLEQAVRDLTALGGTAILALVVLAAVGYLALTGHPRMIAFLVFAIVGGLLLSLLLKAGFDRPRPDFLPHGQHVYTASFPSGHSMNAAVVYLTLGAILARAHARRALQVYVLALAIFITALVGLSRLYLGVHWPTDVLAGWTAGAAWALLCGLGARTLQRRRVLERESPDTADPAADKHSPPPPDP